MSKVMRMEIKLYFFDISSFKDVQVVDGKASISFLRPPELKAVNSSTVVSLSHNTVTLECSVGDIS